MATRNLTILFTDIKDFTARVSDGERADLARIQALNRRLLLPVIRHFEGHVVKSIGDAFLVTFESPTDGVLCGATMTEVLRQHNEHAAEADRLEVRVAINCGDVEVTDDDVHGEPVNIAARLESIAEAGEVYFTEAVYLAMNRREAPSSEVGERLFKGIPHPVRVYKVIQGQDTELTQKVSSAIRMTPQGPEIRDLHKGAGSPRSGPRQRRGLLAGVAIVAIAVLAALLLRADPVETARAQGRDLMLENKPHEAFSALDRAAQIHPELHADAVEAGRAYVHQMRDTASAQAALDWVKEQLAARSYLEPLRTELEALDGQAVAEVINQKRAYDEAIGPLIQGLLERHPKSHAVPTAAAESLKRTHEALKIQMYFVALERGANPNNPAIFDTCVGRFVHASSGRSMTAHRIIKEHFPKQRQAWALNNIATSASGQVLLHCWKILKEEDHDLIRDPYHIALIDMLDGFQRAEQADTTRDLFLKQTDPARRKHLVAVHVWVLDPQDVAGWGGSNFALVKRNLETLKQRWGL